MAYFSSSPPISHPSLWNNHTRFTSYNSSNNDNDSHDIPSSPFGSTTALAAGQGSIGIAPPANGQLSPTFGQAFQDAMNISSNSLPDPLEQQCPSSAIKPPKSSPHLMDISPAASPLVQEKASAPLPERRSSLQKAASFTNTKTFDSTFFERLAHHQSTHSSVSLASTTAPRSRTRTSSSDGGRPLSDKDVNTVQALSNVAAPSLPLKRPTGLMRTSSAAIAAKVNPCEVSPRPSLAAPHLMERAKSDNQLVFDLSRKTALAGEGHRRPSGLSKETVLGARPSIVPYSLQSQGRKISGSSRVRSSLPQQWQDPQSKPPPLHHTHSAPMVKPPDWGKFTALKHNNSDTTVVTRRSLGNDSGSRLVRQIASPNGMEIDGESPARFDIHSKRRTDLACSPGLGSLFEENPLAANASSPLGASAPGPSHTSQFLSIGNTRKRTIEDPDSSFNSIMDEGEEVLASDNDEEQEVLALPGFATESHSNPSPFSRATGGANQRVVHRATSTASLNAASRKRGSGLSTGPFANTISGASAEALGIGHPPSIRDKDSSRHRKMSRNADGRPILVSHRSSSSGSGPITYRRTHSMCDSEFYASPPLETGDSAANPSKTTSYFSSIHGKPKPQRPSLATSVHHHLSQQILPSSRSQKDTTTHLRPEDAFSPPRVVKDNPALQTYQPSPEQSQSFTSGFGCKEAEGKILPCHSVKEDGLMRITSDTLNDLLRGTYDEHIEKFIVVDCRFDYEYAGGHVEGAVNLSTDALVENFFLSHGNEHPLYANELEMPVPSKSGFADHSGNTKKTILVFHCEFSCKRAPTLAKHLRSKDRALNSACYPSVHYPELYVLEGGYAQCWKTYPNHCDPKGYVTMDDPNHLQARTNDLHELRKKRLGIRAKSYTFGENLFSGKIGKAGSANGGQPTKHLSTLNPAHSSGTSSRPTSSSSSGSGAPVPPSNTRHTSFNASLYSGVINTAQLCVHQEEQDDDMHVQGNSSGSAETEEGDTSFSGTKHAAIATGKHHHMMSSEDGQSSSPCGPTGGVAALVLGAGDSPCPSTKPSRPSFIKMASSSGGLFGQFAQRPGPRTLQRANTSQALPFGL